MATKGDLDDFKNQISILLAQVTTLSVPEQYEAIKFVQNSISSVSVDNLLGEPPPSTEPFREPAPKRASRKKVLSPKRRKIKSPGIVDSNRITTKSRGNSINIRAKSLDDTKWFAKESPFMVDHPRSSSAIKTRSSKVVRRDVSENNVGKLDTKTDLPKKKRRKAKIRVKSLKTLCVLCGKVNQNLPGLLRHLFDHQGTAKSCIGCKKSFMNAIGFEYHKVMKLCNDKLPQDKVMSVSNGTSLDRLALKQIIVCPYCSERFTKFFNLRRHLSRKCIPKPIIEEPPAEGNNLMENYLTCGYCKCTLNVNNLLEHMKEYHNHICKRCGESFHTTTLLRRHRDIHKEEVHNHNCKKCGDSFYTLALLKSHMEIHKEPLVPTHHCTICQSSFFTRKKIRLHMKDHTPEERTRHRKESGDEPLKKVKCETCDAYFKNMFSYQRHCRRIHSAKPENVEIVNVIVCDKCGKKVNGDAALQDHIRKSHKELLPCVECSYKASTKNNLERHTRLLHSVNEKRVPCNRCSATFASKTTYKQHLSAVHCAKSRRV